MILGAEKIKVIDIKLSVFLHRNDFYQEVDREAWHRRKSLGNLHKTRFTFRIFA